MVTSTEQAIQRFEENEERIDVFVNDPQNAGYYQTNETPSPRLVETLPHFMADLTARYMALSLKGDWQTSTLYAVKDLVFSGGVTYICLVAHTSGTFSTDAASGKWAVYQGATQVDLQNYVELNSEHAPILAERSVRFDINYAKSSIRYGLNDALPLDDGANLWRGLTNKDGWHIDNIGVGSASFGRNGCSLAYLTTTWGHDCITYGVASAAGGAGSGTGNPDVPSDGSNYGYCSFAYGKDTLARGRISYAFGHACEANSKYSSADGYSSIAGPGLTSHPNENGGSGIASDGVSASAKGYVAWAYGDFAVARGAYVRAYNGAQIFGSGINAGSPLVNSLPNSIAFGRNVDIPTVLIEGGDGTNGGFGKLGINTKKPRERIEALLKTGDTLAIRTPYDGVGTGTIDLQGTLSGGSSASIFKIRWNSPNGGSAYGVTDFYQNGNNFLSLSEDGTLFFKKEVNSVYGYKVAGVKVIGSQLGGISNASAELSSLASAVNAILAAMRTHGLIAS